MTDKILIDSNILIYAYNRTSALHSESEKIVQNALLNGNGTVSSQNLAEFSRVVTEKIPNRFSFEEARNIVLELSQGLEVITYDEQTVADALSICSLYGLHFFDALLAATMEKHNIRLIITENDRDFRKVKWIDVINPFKQ